MHKTVLIGLMVLVGCAHRPPEPIAATAVHSYQAVDDILTSKCKSCHTASRADGGLRLDTWSGVVAGSSFGEVIIPFDPGSSLLLEMATKPRGGAHPHPDGDTLSTAEIAAIGVWIEKGAPAPDGSVAFDGSTNLIYVCGQGSALISVIDTDANVVVRTIDLRKLGFGPMSKPHHVAVEPDGSYWYVSLIGENRILKFSRENALVGSVAFETPGMLAVDPVGQSLYVGRSMTAVNPPPRIGIVDRESMSVSEVEVLFPRPHSLALSSSGDYVFTASLALNSTAAIDLFSEEVVLTSIPGPVQTLVQFAVSPAEPLMVAGGQMSGKLLFFDISDAPRIELFDSLEVGGAPWHPVFTPDGSKVYVGRKAANAVDVIDPRRRQVIRTITGNGIAEPHGSAVSHDGRYVYITNNNVKGAYTPRHDLGDNANVGTVVVIDTSTDEIVKVLEVGNNATGIGARRATGS